MSESRKDWIRLVDMGLKILVLPLIGVLMSMDTSIDRLNENLTVLGTRYESFSNEGVRAIVKEFTGPISTRLALVEQKIQVDSSNIEAIRRDVKRLLEKRK